MGIPSRLLAPKLYIGWTLALHAVEHLLGEAMFVAQQDLREQVLHSHIITDGSQVRHMPPHI